MGRIFFSCRRFAGVSGGLAVLGDTARDLRDLGREVVLVLREAGATPLALPAGLPVVTLSHAA